MRGKHKGENPDTIKGGFIGMNNGYVRPEPIRPDELAEPALADNAPHPRPWTKLPRNRKTKLAVLGISKDLLERGDPRYSRALVQANKYRKARTAELAAMHGFVSAGANALLSSASLALAASRFLYEKYTEQPENFALLKQASSLADSARQSELAAWEMSAREGMVRRKLEAANSGLPWLRQEDQASHGQKVGRPKKAELVQAELEIYRKDEP